jgi:hypothetical protein
MSKAKDRFIFYSSLFLLLCIVLNSCSSSQKNLRVSQSSYCAPPYPYSYDSAYLPLPDIMPILKHDSLLTYKYSYQDLLIANAAGTLLLLQDVIHLEQIRTNDNLVYILIKKQQIFNRLLLASTEVAGLAAELDCESERSKQLGNYLDQINDTRVQRLTILSVITGAATAIGTSVIKNNKAQIAVGVSGSIVGATFGGLAAFSSRRYIVFKHRRNLLSDIWFERKASVNYPPFIWYILNEKEFTNSREYSSIHNLRERWLEEGLIDTTKNKKQEDLYFGDGGKYHADDLHARTGMINQLKAEVRSINQNLQSLMLKLSV